MKLKTKIYILTILIAVTVVLFIAPTKVEAVIQSDSTEFSIFQQGTDDWVEGHMTCFCGYGSGCGCIVVDPKIIPPNE